MWTCRKVNMDPICPSLPRTVPVFSPLPLLIFPGSLTLLMPTTTKVVHAKALSKAPFHCHELKLSIGLTFCHEGFCRPDSSITLNVTSSVEDFFLKEMVVSVLFFFRARFGGVLLILLCGVFYFNT